MHVLTQSPYITHSGRAAFNNMHTGPVSASPPAPLQGADVWGQLTASANFCVHSKQQHSALLAAKGNLLLWGWGRVGWAFESEEGVMRMRGEGGRGTEWGGCTQRWNCVKVASAMALEGDLHFLIAQLMCAGMAQRGIMGATNGAALRSFRKLKDVALTTYLRDLGCVALSSDLFGLTFEMLQTSTIWTEPKGETIRRLS